jgi:hypothetical protein
MYPIELFFSDSYYLLSPLVISAIAFIVGAVAYLRGANQNKAQFIILLALAANLICCTLLTVDASESSNNETAFHAAYSFYSLYVALSFLSVYFPLHVMIRQKHKQHLVTKYHGLIIALIYAGYFFSFITVVSGIVSSIVGSRWEYAFPSDDLDTAFDAVTFLLLHVYWSFILINPVLLYLVYEDLANATYIALIIFNILTTISILTQMITMWAFFDSTATIVILESFLVDFITLSAILTWLFVLKKDISKHQLEMDDKELTTIV